MARTINALEVNLADIIIDKGFNFRSGGVDEKGEKFLDLVESIREYGLKENITVMEGPDGKYHLCDGEHRLRAMWKLGIKRKAVIVREYENAAERFLESVIVNFVRQTTRPYDVAMAAKKLRDEYGFDRKNIASALGKGVPYITSLLNCVDKLRPELMDVFKRNDSEFTVNELIKASRMESDEQLKWLEDITYGRNDVPEAKPRAPSDGKPRLKTREKIKASLADLRGASFIGTSKKKIVATDDVREACAMYARWILGEMSTCPIPEPDVEKD